MDRPYDASANRKLVVRRRKFITAGLTGAATIALGSFAVPRARALFTPGNVTLWYNWANGGSTSVTHDNVGVSGPPWNVLSVTSTPGGSSLRTNLWSFNVPPANGNPFNTGTLTLAALPSPLQPTDSTLLKLIRCGGTVSIQVQFTNSDGTPNPVTEFLLVTLRC